MAFLQSQIFLFTIIIQCIIIILYKFNYYHASILSMILFSCRCHCGLLEETLNKIPGARRMVVGHTIQENGINSACNGKVYRIDVGLSKGCGDGLPEVLEILKDDRIRRVQEQQTSMRKGTGGPSGGGMSV